MWMFAWMHIPIVWCIPEKFEIHVGEGGVGWTMRQDNTGHLIALDLLLGGYGAL